MLRICTLPHPIPYTAERLVRAEFIRSHQSAQWPNWSSGTQERQCYPRLRDIRDGAAAMTRARNLQLGEFLRSRRARINPWDIGLPATDGRRVRGLRREEVARLARVSPDYYTRLEQGRQPTASRQVLDALSRVLRLTRDEHQHLYALANGNGTDPSVTVPSRIVDRGVQRVLDLVGDTPAVLYGPFIDVVTANPAAAFLFADFNTMPAGKRNGLSWMLTSPTARERYGPAWESAASELIGMLRIDAGRFPHHPRLGELVRDLAAHSELFRRLWRDYQVSGWLHDTKILRHPGFGEMEFFNEFIIPKSTPGQNLVLVIPADPVAFQQALNAASPQRWPDGLRQT